MKKFDLALIVIIVLELVGTFIMRNSLSAALLVMLTTLVPLVLMSILGGRVVYGYSEKFSFFNTFAAAAISTIIVLPYSLLFPWEELIQKAHSNINFTPSLNSVVSTLITEFMLTAITFFVLKQRDKK